MLIVRDWQPDVESQKLSYEQGSALVKTFRGSKWKTLTSVIIILSRLAIPSYTATTENRNHITTLLMEPRALQTSHGRYSMGTKAICASCQCMLFYQCPQILLPYFLPVTAGHKF